MNTGVDIRLIVMGISLCFLIYSWLNHRKTMKKVKLKREEMDERHNERMRQHDEHLRRLQGMQQCLTRRPFSWELVPEEWCETDKLSPTKKIITHKMSMTK